MDRSLGLTILTALSLWVSAVSGRAASIALQPTPETCRQVRVGHASAWQSACGMTFAAPDRSTGLAASKSLYVKIVYLDRGEGLLQVSYASQNGRESSHCHTRSSRVNTGEFVASYHELTQPVLDEAHGSSWLDIRLDGSDGTALTVRSVTVQDQPFADAQFQEALRAPWRQPLRFAAPEVPPAATLKGSVMVGYQGWFRTANDLDDRGWFHWFRSRTTPEPPFYTFDMWPQTRIYPRADRVRAGHIRTRSGQPAYLFSSTSEAVVRQHFAWMQEYHIDGAFLQRFLTRRAGGDDGTPEWVLMNVRKAANDARRLWAVEYDVSGMSAATAREVLSRDWHWLHDVLRVTEDPYYARENGKPVVFVWGLPFPDRKFTPEVADGIIDFFQHDPEAGGNYVIGSLPNTWDALSPEWLAHARRCDGTLVWQSHDYAPDDRLCTGWGIDYYPHVWPGFSWAHLTKKREPKAYTSRAGGIYYRSRIAQAFAAGCDRLFVGMFDEYDEGTAIMPMSDDPPRPGPPMGRFLTNRKDPADRWLRITAEARTALEKADPGTYFDSGK